MEINERIAMAVQSTHEPECVQKLHTHVICTPGRGRTPPIKPLTWCLPGRGRTATTLAVDLLHPKT